MKLTPEQHAQFDRDGYLFFPGLFTPEETQTLNDAVPELYSRREDYNVREKGKDAVRTNFAAHMYSKPFAKLGRHPRMIGPVQELLGEDLYMHQFKINGPIMRGWRASLANGLLYMCAAKLVRTASLPFSRTL